MNNIKKNIYNNNRQYVEYHIINTIAYYSIYYRKRNSK